MCGSMGTFSSILTWGDMQCSMSDIAECRSLMLRSEGGNRSGDGGSKGLNGRGEGGRTPPGSTAKSNHQAQGNLSSNDTPVNFNIVSFNVRGLNSPNKRAKVLDYLRRKKVDVALLQETHLTLEDTSRVQNRFYKSVVASADGTHTKGVMILMKRNINIAVEKVGSDKKGRLAFCCTSIQGKKIAFVSIYAPTTFEAEFFPSITSHLLKLNDYQLYIGSDMNAVINANLDKSSSATAGSQDSASKALNSFIEDLNLVDVWRVHNPFDKDYTFFSSRHKTFSRIDYILISSGLLASVHSIQFLPRLLSDHNPIISSFNYGNIKNKTSRWRFNCTLLKNEEFIAQLKSKLTEFISINKSSVVDLTVVWASVKGFIRNNAISFSSHLHRSRLQNISLLEQQCKDLEELLKGCYSITAENELKTKQAELGDLLRRRAEYMIHIL